MSITVLISFYRGMAKECGEMQNILISPSMILTESAHKECNSVFKEDSDDYDSNMIKCIFLYLFRMNDMNLNHIYGPKFVKNICFLFTEITVKNKKTKTLLHCQSDTMWSVTELPLCPTSALITWWLQASQ